MVAQAAKDKYDYDLVIIGCGVGGHGAALHAVEQVRWCHAGTAAYGDQPALDHSGERSTWGNKHTATRSMN